MEATTPRWARIVGWLGLAGHATVLVWYAASGLVAPGWAVAILLAVWAALLGVAIVLLRRHPALVPAVPAAAIAFWFAAVSAGDTFLGWTA